MLGIKFKKDKNKEEETEGNGKILSGVVTSDKMQDTIVVEVLRYFKHPKIGKFIKRKKKYHAHDAGNTFSIGDKVEIRECRPISKTKSFTVVKPKK